MDESDVGVKVVVVAEVIVVDTMGFERAVGVQEVVVTAVRVVLPFLRILLLPRFLDSM